MSDFFTILIFLIITILPLCLPAKYKGKVIWKDDDSLSDKMLKTGSVSIFFVSLMTFIFTIKPTYDFENIKSSNKSLGLENEKLSLKNKELVINNKELLDNKSLYELELPLLKDSINSLSDELRELEQSNNKAKDDNQKLKENYIILSDKSDSLKVVQVHILEEVRNLMNTVKLSSLYHVIKGIIDYKILYYGYTESVNYHKLLNEYLERNPIKLEEDFNYKNGSYYENNAKKIMKEYSKSISVNDDYTIEKVYNAVNYFLENHYDI